MKKLLIFLGILFSVCNSQIANAQTIRVSQALGSTKTLIYVRGTLAVDSAILLPSSDTNYIPFRPYAMIVRTADKTPYMWTGTRWVPFALSSGEGFVTSFNTRSGAVIPLAGDYSADMVTNAVDITQSYANPSWITSLAYSKITGAPAQFNPLPAYGILIGGSYPNKTFGFDSAVVHPVTAIAKLNDTTISFTINNRPPVLLVIPGRGSTGGGGGGGGLGTLTNFSFVPANGFIGSVASSTTTPALTLGTTLNGIIYGNGTSFLSATIGAGLAFNAGVLTNTIVDDNQLANGAGYITNISGLIFPGGGGISITGAGTRSNPYIIGVTGGILSGGSGGSADSIKHLPVDTSASPRNGYVLAFDSVNHKWYLTPNGSGGGGGGSVTRFNFTNGAGFTGVVATPTTTPTLSLTMQNGADDGLTKGIAAYTAADFNVTSGVVAIDYVNGQKATASVPGFLTAADWTTFNNKIGGTLTSGSIYVGNVSNVPTATAVTGDVLLSNAGVTTIQPAVVTYAKIQNIASQRLLGRFAGTSGVAQEISIGSGILLNSSTGILTADTSLIATKYFITTLKDTIGVGHLGAGVQAFYASSDFDSLYDKTHVGGYGVLISTQNDSSMLFKVDTTTIAYKSWVTSQITSGFVHGIDDVLGVNQALTTDKSIAASTHTFFVQGSRTGGLNFVMQVSNVDAGLSGSVFQATTAGNGYGVYGATNGGEGVYGQSTTGSGVHGYGGSGYGVVGESPTGYAGYFSHSDTTGTVPTVYAFNASGPAYTGDVYPITTNTVVTAMLLRRGGSHGGGTGAGLSIDFWDVVSDGSGHPSNSIISKWTNGTVNSQNSQLSITGITNATNGTWMTMDGSGAVFSGTGIGVKAVSGGTGGQFDGTSAGILAESVSTPVFANNLSTSTNTVVIGLELARQATYNGAAGSGSKIVWDSHNSAGSIFSTGSISNLYTTATAGSEVTQMAISLVNVGTTNTVWTLDGNGNQTNTGGHIEKIVNTAAGTYTILANDYTVLFTGTTTTWTFPTGVTGRILNLVNNGSGSITYGTAITTGNGTTTTTSVAGNKDRIQFDGTVWRKLN